jgi:adhesin transport system membrane fusion protein
MVATVDIRTGEKTVMDYLLKPFNKAKEALRERYSKNLAIARFFI